jgi:S-DNA-T family DNA segregation ATPase FtsK/SpoIIIE
MPIPDEQVREYARLIQKTLSDLGHTTQPLPFRALTIAEERYAVLEVDTHQLPPRTSIPRLETPAVLSQLSAVIGKPVKKLNTVGLTYVVVLQNTHFPTTCPLPTPPADLAYAWPFGVTREGVAVWSDLLTTGHLLIGGKPGMGKSTAINAGLVALLQQHTPQSLQLLLIDPKAVELSAYHALPHLAQPIATQATQATESLRWAVELMHTRETQFVRYGARQLADYNRQAPTPLPLTLIVIDEVTDLVLQWGGTKSAPFRDLIRLSSKARAFGIVLVLATQNPKATILDTSVRENSGVRVALKVDAASQARSILGQTGAESLPPMPGRMMVVGLPNGLMTLQGFRVNETEIRRVTE